MHVLHRPDGNLSRLEDLKTIRLWGCGLLDTDRLKGVLGSVRPHPINHLASDCNLRHLDPALARVKESIDRNIGFSTDPFAAANAQLPDLILLIRLGGLEEYGRGPVLISNSNANDLSRLLGKPGGRYSLSANAGSTFELSRANRLARSDLWPRAIVDFFYSKAF